MSPDVDMPVYVYVLPVELYYQIIHYLDIKDVFDLRRVIFILTNTPHASLINPSLSDMQVFLRHHARTWPLVDDVYTHARRAGPTLLSNRVHGHVVRPG